MIPNIYNFHPNRANYISAVPNNLLYGAGFFLEYAGSLGPLEYIHAVGNCFDEFNRLVSSYMYIYVAAMGSFEASSGLLGQLDHACHERFDTDS